MGYRIEYDSKLNRKYPIKVRSENRKMLLLTAVILCTFILGLIGVNNRANLKSWLLPGNPQITEAAFSSVIADIRAGEHVKEAITAFCLEIMENAKIN